MPPSVAGRSSFLTMIVPVLRVLVIVQVIVSPSPTVDVQRRPALGDLGARRVLAGRGGRVVGQVRAGLADGVRAGVDDLRAGAAVADLRRDVVAVDLEVEQPASVDGTSCFLTMIVPVLRVLVIVQVIVSPSPTFTAPRGRDGHGVAAGVLAGGRARVVARYAPVSPTVCVPVLTTFEPVPPSPTCVATLAPSTWRSNRPASVDGMSCFLTTIVPVLRVLVIVQVIVSCRHGDVQRAAAAWRRCSRRRSCTPSSSCSRSGRRRPRRRCACRS